MHRRDVNKLLAAYAVAPVLVPAAARAQTCESRDYPKTAAESAAAVNVVDTSRCPGDWRRYGADPTGNTDSTVAIQAACNANQLAFDAGGTYLVSATIKIPSGVTVRGAGVSATQVACADGGISVFMASGATAVVVEKLKISVTAVSKEAHTGAVEFRKSTHCACNECEIVGCNWHGVWIFDSAYCTVDRCHFHDFQGSVQDSSDVCIYNVSHHNTVTNNKCFGGNWHGIAVQDPYSNSLPSNNMVANNSVAGQQAYGLMVYMPYAGDTFNQLIGNSVENIQGSVLGRDSGAGIYVVGAGAGGTTVANNTVRNCCIQTTVNRTMAPAGIGVSGIAQVAAPVTVSGNTVSDVRAHDGILVVSCKGSVTVSGNTATLPPGNSTGTPIRIDASSNVSVTGNSAVRAPDTNGRCIFVYANAIAVSNISVTGNTCYGGSYAQIEFYPTAGGTISNVACTNNTCHGKGSNPNCVRLVGVQNAEVSGNKCLAAG
jgi:parallel beta-helix repeat protein